MALRRFKLVFFRYLSNMMASSIKNTTDVSTAPAFTLPVLLRTIYAAILSKLPFRFSYVEQVHVKLKAEAAVMFAFYILKQIYKQFMTWYARRATVRQQMIEGAVIETKKRRKQKKRNKKSKGQH